MLHRAAPLKICLIGAMVLLVSACQPKVHEETASDAASAASATATQVQRLNAKVQPLALALPACRGKSCPEFFVARLNSNYAFIDAAIDQAIMQNLSEILDPESIQTAMDAHDAAAHHNSTPPKLEQTPAAKTSSQTPTQLSTDSAASQPQLASMRPEQALSLKIQPYLNGFLSLDQEMKSLGMTQAISLMIKPSVVDAKAPIVTVVLNSSHYMGGAHGAATQRYYNFDLKTEQPLLLQDIVLSGQQQALRDKAHAVFATWVMDNKLANNLADYEQAWPFSVSDNFYLAPQGLILQYGEYEIGPYVVGLPRLVIPYYQLQGIIKPQYLPANAVNQAAAKTAPAAKVAS